MSLIFYQAPAFAHCVESKVKALGVAPISLWSLHQHERTSYSFDLAPSVSLREELMRSFVEKSKVPRVLETGLGFRQVRRPRQSAWKRQAFYLWTGGVRD